MVSRCRAPGTGQLKWYVACGEGLVQDSSPEQEDGRPGSSSPSASGENLFLSGVAFVSAPPWKGVGNPAIAAFCELLLIFCCFQISLKISQMFFSCGLHVRFMTAVSDFKSVMCCCHSLFEHNPKGL